MSFEIYNPDGTLAPDLVPTGFSELHESICFGHRPCANCHKKGSSLWCGGCHVSDLGKIRTFYCSEACQGAHWKIHQGVCKARRKFFRAVSILAELWFKFEEKTWVATAKLDAVKEKVVLTSAIADNLDARGWTGRSIFRDFPRDAVPTKTDDAVKKALLFDNTCVEIVVTGRALLDLFSRGNIRLKHHRGPLTNYLTATDAALTFVNVEVKAPALVVRYQTMQSHDQHGILIASLATGDKYVLDFSGAQYGWKEKVYDYATFYGHRSHPHCLLQSPPTSLDETKRMENMVYLMLPPDSVAVAASIFRRSIAAGMVAEINKFAKSQDKQLKGILGLPENQFPSARNELVEAAISGMHQAILKLEQKRATQLFYNSNFELRAVMTEEKAKIWDNVWLSGEEYQANRGNLKALKKLWADKVAKSSGI